VFESWAAALRERWRFYAVLGLSWFVLAAVLWSGPRVHSAGFGVGVSAWTYLLNQTTIIPGYLWRGIWPRALVLNYGWPVPLTLGAVWPDFFFLVGLAVATLVALVRWRPWGFLGAWVFVTLAPTSSIVPITTEVGADRRMYLPLIGLAVLGIVTVSCLRRTRPAAFLLAVTTIALAATTVARNRDYASELQLARTSVERHPSAVGHHALGAALLDAGRNEDAIAELRLALPGAPRARFTLGEALLKEERWPEAITELDAFVRDQPLLVEAIAARTDLGYAFSMQARWAEALEQYRLVLTMHPPPEQRTHASDQIGEVLYRMQRLEEALPYLTSSLSRRPADAGLLSRVAISLAAAGRQEEAIVMFRRASDVDPNDGASQLNLATALFDHREFEAAAAPAQRAVALRANDRTAHELLGRIWAVKGQFKDAQREFELALKIAPGDPEAQADLARLKQR
jgi:protein O-mannosyl-transferase